MKILNARQMAEVDSLTTERYLVPSILLMENAGRSVADEIERSCPGLQNKSISILCGPGNNGGDGFVVARHLALRNAHPSVVLFAEPERLKGDALTNFKIASAMEIPISILPVPASSKSFLAEGIPPDIIVDALFGTGLSKPIGPGFGQVVNWINKCSRRSYVVAVDIPSGLVADSPLIPGPAVKAQLTVTFTALKLAQIMPPAADLAGRVVLAQIGSPSELLDSPEYRLNLIDSALVRSTVPVRDRDSHKGSFGHVYVVAGSRGKGGAALMTGLAALRAGAGLVTLWLPQSLQQNVSGRFPELMTEPLPETDEGTSTRAGAERLLEQLRQADALVLGPGLTTNESTKRLVWELVHRSPVPVVLDADGINAFVSPAEPLVNELGQPVVITPHPGEMARLTGKNTSQVQESRIDTARECAARFGCFVVFKGFQTVVAGPEGDVFINNTGNPGMASGGTGDILSGMVGRFVAAWKKQDSRSLLHFLSSAVHLHGLAGDVAAEKEGVDSLIATDILTFLPEAFRRVSQE